MTRGEHVEHVALKLDIDAPALVRMLLVQVERRGEALRDDAVFDHFGAQVEFGRGAGRELDEAAGDILDVEVEDAEPELLILGAGGAGR